jgi:hypothetical protein
MRNVFLMLAVASTLVPAARAQTSAPPVLSVAMENAVTQPGNLRLIRPLVLFISGWSGESPRVRAYTYTGTVTAEVTRIPSNAGHWDATAKYTVIEAPGARPGSGEVTLHLTIRGTTVLGSFEGKFRDLMIHGAAKAGLTWDLGSRQNYPGMLLWLPDPARPVRAAVLWGNGPGLSEKHSALREDLQAFGAANRLAVIGLEGFGIDMARGDGPALVASLKTLGEMSGHPELDSVPILFSGHSMGGQIAYEFNAWKPERIIAFTVSKGGNYATWQASDRARANPAVLSAGEKDTEGRVASIRRLFDGNRPRGAAWSLEVEEGVDHAFGRSLPLFLLHLQHALDQRLPVGASRILPVDQHRAWFADNTTWHDGIARIFPAAGFKGDATHLSWLLDRDVAYVYRGVATYGNPLQLALTAGHGIQYFADEPVVVECTDFGPGEWKSVALYDGAKRVAAITRHKPRVTLLSQKPGVHAGVLIGERPDGSLRTSWPVAWVVRPALEGR